MARGDRGEEETLRSCYRSVFGVVRQHNLASIAFPSISTGAFSYPIEKAAPVAMSELLRAQREALELEITVVCFEPSVFRAYQKVAV